jgi:toxin ParE1/3/4
MATFRLSSPARADLEAILRASQERWGDDGRDRYARLISNGMRMVAEDPEAPTTRARNELFEGIRSLHVRHARTHGDVRAPVHVVFYRKSGDVIEIVRVLHERVDPSRHIEPPTSIPKPRGKRS